MFGDAKARVVGRIRQREVVTAGADVATLIIQLCHDTSESVQLGSAIGAFNCTTIRIDRVNGYTLRSTSGCKRDDARTAADIQNVSPRGNLHFVNQMSSPWVDASM